MVKNKFLDLIGYYWVGHELKLSEIRIFKIRAIQRYNFDIKINYIIRDTSPQEGENSILYCSYALFKESARRATGRSLIGQCTSAANIPKATPNHQTVS